MTSPSPHLSTVHTRAAQNAPELGVRAICLRVPPIVVNAGAGGARLSIRLLAATQLVLPARQALVLHDPVGLTGERLLAHIYQSATRSLAGLHRGHEVESDPLGYSVRWLEVQAPLARVWDSAERRAERAWRPRREAPFNRRVAERVNHSGTPSPASPAGVAGILLLSESLHADALAPHAVARLVTRALRRDWCVFAVTREGPVSDTHPMSDSPPWREHLVCRGGVLVPLHSGAPATRGGHAPSVGAEPR